MRERPYVGCIEARVGYVSDGEDVSLWYIYVSWYIHQTFVDGIIRENKPNT